MRFPPGRFARMIVGRKRRVKRCSIRNRHGLHLSSRLRLRTPRSHKRLDKENHSMKLCSFTAFAVLTLLFVVPATPRADDKPEWKVLFDAKTLAGWKSAD